jgi:hypothetical protein
MGDAATGCVWGEEVTGDRFNVALPPGWTASADPVAVLDEDGNVFARAGENLAGGEAQFPWWRSGDVLCQVDGAVDTVRFSEMETPSSHIDDERRD